MILGRARAWLGRFALPAIVIAVIATCLWFFWCSSSATTIPIADRRLHSIYSLEEGEVLRLIPPPPIPERSTFTAPFKANPRVHVIVRWDGNAAQPRAFFGGRILVDGLLMYIANHSAQFVVDPALNGSFAGDWVISAASLTEGKLRALEDIMRSHLGRSISIKGISSSGKSSS